MLIIQVADISTESLVPFLQELNEVAARKIQSVATSLPQIQENVSLRSHPEEGFWETFGDVVPPLDLTVQEVARKHFSVLHEEGTIPPKEIQLTQYWKEETGKYRSVTIGIVRKEDGWFLDHVGIE